MHIERSCDRLSAVHFAARRRAQIADVVLVRGVVDQNIASWNQLISWLDTLNGLRRAA